MSHCANTPPLSSGAAIPVSGHQATPSRRAVLASAAALATGTMVHSSSSARETAGRLRIGVIGCGGRGAGAVNDSLTINDEVKIVAAADLYPSKCAALRQSLEPHGDKVAIDDSRIYGGLDGYRRVLDDPEVDIVFITTSPGFRPGYVKAAIEAGKHVFTEKPACVDPAGYRICLEAHDAAVARGLAIVTGTQYRRQSNYVAAVDQIRRGAIGEVVGATARYCSGGIWDRPRTEGMSDAEYQLNNWYHFVWLSGDHIVEQAVHNIDTMNWVMGDNPISAFGSGGRFSRPDESELWDSFSIDFEYPGRRVVSFMCRQIPGAATDVSNVVYGSTGQCHIGAGNAGSRILDAGGEEVWSMQGSIADAYRAEHKDLVDSIRAGRPIVELRSMADSSLVAVMGRLAAYTGQRVSWEFVSQESTLDLFPTGLTWESALPSPKPAVPGKTRLV